MHNHRSPYSALRIPHSVLSRRALLQRTACGFGHVALLGLASDALGRTAETSANPLAPKPFHHRPRAQRVIFIFLHGGLSHFDSFDPKPKLTKMNGKPLPFDKPKFSFAKTGNLMASPWQFQKYGQSGIEVSQLFPEIGRSIDDFCVVRSMNANQVAHGGACLQLHTGEGIFVRPCMGSWILYGLGSENQNLPGFITISPTAYHGGAQMYGSAFLPASYQGARIGDGSTRFSNSGLPNLSPAEQDTSLQRMQLDLLKHYNQSQLQKTGFDDRLEARIVSFELAFRMQMTAPPVMDLSEETEETQRLYGIGTEPINDFGRQCLLARRFAENGVRFVQVSHSYPRNYWDAHGELKKNHSSNAVKVDRPIAGLIRDLERRGLLDDTLVIVGTEFGRTPAAQGGDGRDHHPHAFTMLLAGGGVRGGMTYGVTDEFGYYVTADRVHMNDFHATLLHLLGLDHERLTFRYSGRDFRLSDVHGRVVKNTFT